jgi:hypothetical protein
VTVYTNMLIGLMAKVRTTLLLRLTFICASTPHNSLLRVFIFYFFTQKAKIPNYCTHSDLLRLVNSKVSFTTNFTEVTGKYHTSVGLIMEKELS